MPSGILMHPAVWPQKWAENLGALSLLGGEELGPHPAKCGLDQGPPPSNCHLDPSSHMATPATDVGRKLGKGLRFLFEEGG